MGSPALTALMAGACIWSLTSTIGLARVDLDWQLFWANLAFVGIGLVPPGWLLFALQYTRHPRAHDRRLLAALAVEPLAVLLIVWTNPSHLLFRSDVALVERGGLTLLSASLGPLFWAHAVYAYLLLLLGSGLLIWHVSRTRGIYRKQVAILLLAIGAPWVANALYLAGLSPLPDWDLTPVGFALAGVALAWDLRRLRLLDILPVARDTLIEQMSDGMLVLDPQGRVADLNAAACATLGVQSKAVLGQHASQAFAAWPQLTAHYERAAPHGVFEIGLGEGKDARVFEVRVSPLAQSPAQAGGTLIFWHEITARKQAEERLRALDERLVLHVRDTPLGYIEWDVDLRVRAWNHAAERIFGYSEAEVLGRRIRDLLVPERFWPQIDALQKQLQSRLGGTRSTNVNCTRDGREIICEWHNTVFVDQAGRVTGWGSLVEDITERTRTAEALEESNLSLQARIHELSTLSQITQTIVTEPTLARIAAAVAEQLAGALGVRTCLVVLHLPEQYRMEIVAQFGRDTGPGELVGITAPVQLVPPEVLSALSRQSFQPSPAQLAALASLFGLAPERAASSSVLITPLLMRDALHGCIVLAHDEPQRVAGAVRLVETVAGQLSGVIERVRLLELAELAREAAEAASRAKSQFLAAMSHELRTPLNGILGYAQLLQGDDGKSSFHREAVRQIIQSGDHLLALINDLLDLSKIEAGTVALDEEPIDLPALLNDVAAVAEIQARHKGLRFTLGLSSEAETTPLPQTLAVDARRLRQVLLNLLGNAVKFTDSGEVMLTVAYEPIPTGTGHWSIRFQIDDTGIGIAEDDLRRITAPFQQVNTPNRRVEGAGLGLSITVELLRLMGSELHMTSKPGKGSQFWFALTLAETQREPAELTPAPLQPAPPPERGRTALVIDDDPVSRELLATVLTRQGWRVTMARDGAAGLRAALAAHPDVVVADLMMPEIDGIGLVTRLRQEPAFHRTAIVTLSAHAAAEQGQASLKAGSDVHITKPFQVDTLLSTLDRLVTQRERAPAPQGMPSPQPPPGPAAAARLSVAERDDLRDLVIVGDLETLAERAARLGAQRPEVEPLARTLRRYAEQFDIDALLALLSDTASEATTTPRGR
jgi:PAS domain S-box-containing protein